MVMHPAPNPYVLEGGAMPQESPAQAPAPAQPRPVPPAAVFAQAPHGPMAAPQGSVSQAMMPQGTPGLGAGLLPGSVHTAYLQSLAQTQRQFLESRQRMMARMVELSRMPQMAAHPGQMGHHPGQMSPPQMPMPRAPFPQAPLVPAPQPASTPLAPMPQGLQSQPQADVAQVQMPRVPVAPTPHTEVPGPRAQTAKAAPAPKALPGLKLDREGLKIHASGNI